MGRYKQPRRLNTVSILVVLALAFAGYFAVKVTPPYYRFTKAKGILDDSLAQYYQRRQLTGSAEVEFLDRLKKKTVNHLRRLGLVDPKLDLSFRRDASMLVAAVRYRERFRHLFVKKITTMHFETERRTAAKSVQ